MRKSPIAELCLLIDLVQAGLLSNHSGNIAAPVHYMQNSDIVSIDPVDDDIAARCHTAQALAEIVAATAESRMLGELEKRVGDGFDYTVGNLQPAALGSDVGPDIVEIGSNFPTDQKGH
jgi:hypothetical protein